MTQVAANRADRPDDLVASGTAIEMRFRPGRKALSLKADKMLHLLVKGAGVRLQAHQKHRLPVADLRELAHLAGEGVRELAGELLSTVIEIRTPVRFQLGGILDYVEVEAGAAGPAELVYRFSETMVAVFSADERWAILSKSMVLRFESRYGLRLFEIMSLRTGMNQTSEVFDLDDLRARLGVDAGKLQPFSNLRARCIEPAVAEVNAITGLSVEYEILKRSRAVTGIQFKWRQRSHRKAMEAHSQTSSISVAPGAKKPATGRPKAGKLVFPAGGSIAYAEPWASIARAKGGGWDVDAIAVAFREHCVAKKLALTSKGIEAAFRGFCTAFFERRGRP